MGAPRSIALFALTSLDWGQALACRVAEEPAAARTIRGPRALAVDAAHVAGVLRGIAYGLGEAHDEPGWCAGPSRTRARKAKEECVLRPSLARSLASLLIRPKAVRASGGRACGGGHISRTSCNGFVRPSERISLSEHIKAASLLDGGAARDSAGATPQWVRWSGWWRR